MKSGYILTLVMVLMCAACWTGSAIARTYTVRVTVRENAGGRSDVINTLNNMNPVNMVVERNENIFFRVEEISADYNNLDAAGLNRLQWALRKFPCIVQVQVE